MKHLLSALVIFFMICTAVKGEEHTFSFSGTMHELDGEYSYFTGQPFEIVYTFESKTYDADPDDPESGIYSGAIKSGILTISSGRESIHWVVDPDGASNAIEVKDLDAADSYVASASVSGPAVGRKIPAYFRIELMDRDATALSSDKLPSSLEIRSFDNHRIVQFTFIGSRQYVYSTLGIITSAKAPVAHSDTFGDGSPDETGSNF